MFWRYFIVNIHVNGLTGYFSRVCFLFFQLNLEICPIVARKNSNLSSFSIWDTTLLFQLTRYWKAQASNSNQSKLEKLKSWCRNVRLAWIKDADSRFKGNAAAENKNILMSRHKHPKVFVVLTLDREVSPNQRQSSHITSPKQTLGYPSSSYSELCPKNCAGNRQTGKDFLHATNDQHLKDKIVFL